MAAYLKHSIIVLLMLVTGTVALTTYKQYGVAWDEAAQVQIGTTNYDYIFRGDQKFFRFDNRFYGPVFELSLIALGKALNLKTTRDVFLMRHLTSHLFFLLGAAFCFLLVDFLYKNKLLATIAFLLVVFNPRIYAHSFFNTKDVPFLSMCFICLYLNAFAFDKKRVREFLFLGIASGLLINLRLMGVLFSFCVLLFLLVDALYGKYEGSPTANLWLAMTYLGAATITLYATWPFLWKNPVENFIYAFNHMSKYGWQGVVLFKGVFFKPSELPWSYIPTWFAITTPLAYMIAGLFGILLLFIHFAGNPRRFVSNTRDRNNLLFAICFFAPVVIIILLNSSVYDGWRHMYFIYTGFVFLAVYGLNHLFKSRLKPLAILILLLSFCSIGYFMVENFPHQNIYFNPLVDRYHPEKLRRQYDLDYWGTSYKEALEYILSKDSSPVIHVAFENKSGEFNVYHFPEEERKRLKVIDNMNNATYYVTNYRFRLPDVYSHLEDKKYHAIRVFNNTINEVFKLK